MTADRLLKRVSERLRERAANAGDLRVTIGGRVLGADVHYPDHGRLMGLAHRPDGAAAELNVGSVDSLIGGAADSDNCLRRAAAVATLNALSVPAINWRVGDPMAALSADVDVVATVGLFQPAFQKFADVTVRVVERDPPPPSSVDAPEHVCVETYEPDDCAAAFHEADVCFVTGSTLIYGGVERYLSALAAADVEPIVLVGATASHIPEPAFNAGVDVVAGALVTDPEGVHKRVRDGDCDTDLHGAGVEKVYVSRARDLPGLALEADVDHEPAVPSKDRGTVNSDRSFER